MKYKLDEIAEYFSMKTGFNGYFTKYRFRKIVEVARPGCVLDLGCADGFLSECLGEYFDRVLAIDGSATMIEHAKARVTNPKVEFQ